MEDGDESPEVQDVKTDTRADQNVPDESDSVQDHFRQDPMRLPNIPPLQLLSDEQTAEQPKDQVRMMDYNFGDDNPKAMLMGTSNMTQQMRGSFFGRSRSSAINSNPQVLKSADVVEPAPRKSDPIGSMFEDVRQKIETQNNSINELKAQLEMAEAKFPQTAETRNEVNNLKKKIEAGLSLLNNLYKDARQIQEKDPERPWPVLAFATTLEEDNDKSSGFDYDTVLSNIEPLSFPGEENPLCSASTRSGSQESLFARPRIRRPGRPQAQKVSDERDCERRRLQEELANRDKAVERLHKKVLKMQAELTRLCKERQQERFDSNSVNEDCNDSVLNTGADDDCEMFDVLNQRFQKIQKDILNNELEETSTSRRTSRRTQPPSEFQKKYCELLEEYAKKDCKIQKLQAQLDSLTKRVDNQNVKDPISDILRKQLEESREENDSQKVIICEQAEQIEEYHEKYLESLQKNEELKCIAKRLQMDNRKVEDQINLEIKQIKNKFESKLAEYAEYPKLLENEQMKLSQVTQEKQEIERKLRVVCLEFKKLRDEHEMTGNGADGGSNCRDCDSVRDELKEAHSQLDAMRQCYTAMTNRFDSTKLELDTLRKESAKVICRLKERAEEQRLKLQNHIHRLETNLAKARAAVSITSADKETTVKDMQGQLNCLATCLDSSQKQIKTLKDHIAYLNNGKTKSVVICCQADEKNL